MSTPATPSAKRSSLPDPRSTWNAITSREAATSMMTISARVPLAMVRAVPASAKRAPLFSATTKAQPTICPGGQLSRYAAASWSWTGGISSIRTTRRPGCWSSSISRKLGIMPAIPTASRSLATKGATKTVAAPAAANSSESEKSSSDWASAVLSRSERQEINSVMRGSSRTPNARFVASVRRGWARAWSAAEDPQPAPDGRSAETYRRP